jgi:hypothetical protein
MVASRVAMPIRGDHGEEGERGDVLTHDGSPISGIGRTQHHNLGTVDRTGLVRSALRIPLRRYILAVGQGAMPPIVIYITSPHDL